MSNVNTKQMADKIGTDTRTLRRFIRQDPTYKNAGSGGRYEFTDKDIPTLKDRFTKWRDGAEEKVSKTRSKKPSNVEKFVDQDTPMPVSMLGRRMTRSQREARDAASRARVDRLEERLRASGKHISQYTDWAEKARA
jgi:DNA-binding transcriptional MerR regulator